MEIFETKLPGVGVRYEFTTESGDRVGVVVRRNGKRDMAIYDRTDPDACRGTIELGERDSSRLAELLGGTTITERLEDLRHTVEGLAIEWITMPDSGGLTDKTIADGRIRTQTSASIVAVIRGEHAVPGPGPSFEFIAGDVVLVMGAASAVRAASLILTGT
jgi:TrkA domain protein